MTDAQTPTDEQIERDGYDQFWDAVEDAPHRHADFAQVIDTLRSAWLVRDLTGNDFDLARAALSAMQPSPAEAAKVLTAEDRENIVDEIESIICETHELDVRDVDYAENIVSWLERHHPAALRAIAGEGQ